jgi:coenzyme F420 hydrogenase subunit beta
VDDPSSLLSLRYRGNGWPGKATAEFRTPDGGTRTRELTYEASWGDILQKHRQWRCYVCADHTGEFADIAVGDPWHRPIGNNEPGRSLILARTPHGQRVIEQAIEAGYLVAEPAEADILPRSQPNLLKTRGSIWARIWVCRLMGAAAPRFKGMPMFRFWLTRLSLVEKLRSITGTVKRVLRKGLRRRAVMRFARQSGATDPPRRTAAEGREVVRAVPPAMQCSRVAP